jgi:hypothetical protein
MMTINEMAIAKDRNVENPLCQVGLPRHELCSLNFGLEDARMLNRIETATRRTTLSGFRSLLWCLLIGWAALGTSCRLHDAGRLDVAKSAAQTASQVQDGNKSPFAAMEENLAVVESAYKRTADQEFAFRERSFYAGLDRLDREDLLEEIESTLDQHTEIETRIDSACQAAAQAVRRALQQSPIATSMEDSDLDLVLHKLDDVAAKLSKAMGNLRKWLDDDQQSAGNDNLAKTGDELAQRLSKIISEAAQDKTVESAKRLEIEAARAAVSAHQSWLAELRRHVTALKVIQEAFDVRHSDFVDDLIIPTLSRIDAEQFAARYQALKGKPASEDLIAATRV